VHKKEQVTTPPAEEGLLLQSHPTYKTTSGEYEAYNEELKHYQEYDRQQHFPAPTPRGELYSTLEIDTPDPLSARQMAEKLTYHHLRQPRTSR